MKLELKIHGLTVVAALALSAIWATPALATYIYDFNSDAPAGKPTYLHATGEGTQTFKSTFTDSTETTCKTLEGSGTIIGPQVETVIIAPTYKECHILTEGKELSAATVTSTGCRFDLLGKTTSTGTSGLHAAFAITCDLAEEGFNKIDIDVTVFNFPCIEVHEQSPVHGLSYSNKEEEGEGAEKSVTVSATVYGLENETVGVCEDENPEENLHKQGIYTGNILVEGENEESKPTNIWTTETKVGTGE